MRAFWLSAIFGSLLASTAASATTLFTENFDSETPKTRSTLTQFDITGSVDTVATVNPFGIAVSGPASGNVLDIDGTGASGRITSLGSFAFNSGDLVELSFDLGGSQRGGAGDSFVTTLLFGAATAYSDLAGTGLYSALTGSGSAATLVEELFIPGTTPFTSSSIAFVAQNAGSLKFAFSSPSADNIGPLLDNISLRVSRPSAAAALAASAVPEPATWTMLILGFSLTGLVLRRRPRPPVRATFAA